MTDSSQMFLLVVIGRFSPRDVTAGRRQRSLVFFTDHLPHAMLSLHGDNFNKYIENIFFLMKVVYCIFKVENFGNMNPKVLGEL